MPEPTNEKKSNLPFGASPTTLAILGLALIGAIAYLAFPNLFGGQPSPSGETGTASGAAVVTKAKEPNKPGQEAATAEEDPFASFLVHFGRANPFAPVSLGPNTVTSSVPGTSSSGSPSGGMSTLESLRQRVKELQEGAGQEGSTGTASKDSGSASGLAVSSAPSSRPNFTLTGLVRLEGLALAVITYGNKTYIVGPGDSLEKTGYRVKEIGEDKVILVSDGGALELVLRRGKG